MPFAWKPQDRDTLNHWLNTIFEEASDDLNEWETNFINDIQIKLQNKWSLTQRQEEMLEKIYVEKTK